MKHRATPDFWYYYRQLPIDIQQLADRCYELLREDPKYPSLHFKKVGQFWSVRIGINTARFVHFQLGIWFWEKVSQRGLGGFPHERLANPEGVKG